MPRADSVRNRQLLVEAAAAELAEHGLDVSIARIATRAGVAKGTVFNHFASKEELVAAIFCAQLDGLVEAGAALLDDADPGAALLRFMGIGVELQSRDRALCEAVTVTSRADPAVRAVSDRLAEVAEALTDRARRAGAVRTDVTGQDIVLLLGAATRAAAPLAGVLPDLWRRYLHLMFDGLRPEAARPLPVAPPTIADFDTAAGG